MTHRFKKKKSFRIGESLLYHNRKIKLKGISHLEFEKNWAITNRDGILYLPPFCSLIEKIRKDFKKKPFNEFQEMAFSRIISKDTANKFGLLRAWPYILFSVEAFRELEDRQLQKKNGGKYFLDPVQCAPFYSWLTGKVFLMNELPLKVYEKLGGWSFRNESASKMKTGLRDLEFLRDEYIFIGTEHQVKAIRFSLIDSFCDYLEKLDMEYRILVGRGCFQEEEKELKSKLRLIKNPEDIPVLDVEMYIPKLNFWLEILGASYWGSTQVENFNIRGKNFMITSGCVGIGISRLAYSLLSQDRSILRRIN